MTAEPDAEQRELGARASSPRRRRRRGRPRRARRAARATSQNRNPRPIVATFAAMSASEFCAMARVRPPARGPRAARGPTGRRAARGCRRAAGSRAPGRSHPDVVEDARSRRKYGIQRGSRRTSASTIPRTARGERQAEERHAPRSRCLPIMRPRPSPSASHWSTREARSRRRSGARRPCARRRRCARRSAAGASAARCPRPRGSAASKPCSSRASRSKIGGDEAEPALAAARAVMVGERLPPVARAADAVQAGLQRGVAALLELVEQRRQRALGQETSASTSATRVVVARPGAEDAGVAGGPRPRRRGSWRRDAGRCRACRRWTCRRRR